MTRVGMETVMRTGIVFDHVQLPMLIVETIVTFYVPMVISLLVPKLPFMPCLAHLLPARLVVAVVRIADFVDAPL